MHTYSEIVDQALIGSNGELTPESTNILRQAHTALLESRWNDRLNDLRRRARLTNLPTEEQAKALLRLARLSNLLAVGRPKAHKRDPQTACLSGWNPIAFLGSNQFDYGNPETPQNTPADPTVGAFDITANTTVALTNPTVGQIGVGAGAGTPYGVAFPTTQSFGLFAGNRSSASLTKKFFVPDLPNLAPNVVMVSCNVLTPGVMVGMLPKNPPQGDGAEFVTFACGQATLDIVVGKLPLEPPGGAKHAVGSEAIFTESAFYNVGPDGVLPSYALSASISQPGSSNYVLATISVEVSAWYLPSTNSLAVVDATGSNSDLPILFVPSGVNSVNSEFNSQLIQVSGLRVCGI